MEKNINKDPNKSFGKLYWKMFTRFSNKDLENDAILLYARLLDMTNLSKSKSQYIDKNGEAFVCFTETMAEKQLRIKKGKFFQHKKKLKELGLINYGPQKIKMAGVSTPIYVTPFDIWIKNNSPEEDLEEDLEESPEEVLEETSEELFDYPDYPEENINRHGFGQRL